MTYEPSDLVKEGARKINYLAEELTNGRGAFENADNAVRVFKYLQQISEHMPLLLSRASSVLEQTARNPEHAAEAARCVGEAVTSATTLAAHLEKAQQAARDARRT
ncbi:MULTISPECIES: hypothetical protein [Streptomyces]|uniref:Uncharacterized protein n=1 Tax=Streptomyces ramulosus TaxID=47762 RepID=A0ABW1FGS0_9ACTN